MLKPQAIIILLILLLIPDKAFSQKTILWSVKHHETPHVSYLLGTYHYIGNSFVDSLPKIKNTLISSDVAIFESIAKEEKIVQFLNTRNEDYTYQEFLSESDLTFLKQLSADWAVPISKLTPVLLMLKLQQVYFETQCGTVKITDEWKHFDRYLQHIAKENNVRLVGLESDTMMYHDLNSAISFNDWSSMKKTIHDWLNNIKKGGNRKRLCKNGMDYMRLSFDYQFDQECGNNVLVKGRNERWMSDILSHINDNNCFIVVGLLHLYGDCGLIMQLRKSGYTVEPVLHLSDL